MPFNIGSVLLCLLLIVAVTFTILYYVIRGAVLSALRQHAKSRTGSPGYVELGLRPQDQPEDPRNFRPMGEEPWKPEAR